MMKALVAFLCLLAISTVTRAAELENAVARRMNYLNSQLSLDGDQSKQIESILKSISRSEREMSPAAEDRRPQDAKSSKTSPDRAKKIHDSVLSLLSPQQAASYQTLVDRENEWWLDPQLLQMDTMLDLSLDQCRKLFPVLRRNRLRERALRESIRTTGDRGAVDSLRKEMKESNEVILEFLDKDQQELWKDHIEAIQKQREKMRSKQGQGMGNGHRGIGG